MDILDCIRADHDRIRKILTELMSEYTSPEWKYRLFRELSLLAESHAKAEEATLLRFAREFEELRFQAMVSYEEHELMDELVHKIRVTEDPEAWEARVKIYCDLLDRHLKDEAEGLFPEVEARLEAVEGVELGDTYMRLCEICQGAETPFQGRLFAVV